MNADPGHELDRSPIDELVACYAAERHCPTVAWGVVHGGQLLAGANEHIVYRIASMTKAFSAAATLWLRDAGALRLDDPIGAHAPELSRLRSGTSDAPPITIRDLLSMTSGLATDDPWADRHLDLTDAEFDRIIAGGPVFAVPTGIGFEYSNFGFAVLGRVVERASGRRIQDIVTDELLSPLGMRSTTWSQPTGSEWAPPLDWVDDRFVDERPPLGDGLIAPMGGLWTTVADLATWVAWLDDAFPARDDPDHAPLSRASRREMQTIQRYVGTRSLRGITSPTGYGYGLRILNEAELGTVVTHSGGLPGYGSNMRWLPGRGTGVVALSNATYAPMTELTARILDLVVGQGFGVTPLIAVSDEMRALAENLVLLLGSEAERWDSTAAALLADNVALDMSFDRRRAQASDVIAGKGPLTIVKLLRVTDADTTVELLDSSGAGLHLTFSIAPVTPLRIQEYDLSRCSPD